jgi:hypothetical protein
MWGKMLNPAEYSGLGLVPNSYLLAACMLIFMMVAWLASSVILPRIQSRVSLMLPARIAGYTAMLVLDIIFLQSKTEFIYFQF